MGEWWVAGQWVVTETTMFVLVCNAFRFHKAYKEYGYKLEQCDNLVKIQSCSNIMMEERGRSTKLESSFIYIIPRAHM